MPDRGRLASVVAAEFGELRTSEYQRLSMLFHDACDLFFGGGRGGGKTYLILLLFLRHIVQCGARARCLYVRQSHRGCADFIAMCLDVFALAFGPNAVRFNGQEGLFRFPNGATLEVNQLADAGEYQKFQGRSFTLIAVDEITQYATPELIDRLRSNLRAPKGIPTRMLLAGNPGEVGHYWVAKRYVFRGASFTPFIDDASGRQFVYCPSTLADNEFIDQDAYLRQLKAACPTDPELLRAWVLGDWAVNRGAYFAAVLDETRNAVDPWAKLPKHHGEPWDAYLAHDFGSSAPSVTYVVAESPGAKGPDGRFYPRGSLVLIDELATNEPGSLTKGLGWTVPKLADAINEMCARWDIVAEGVADDAIFAKSRGQGADSIADEFRLRDVHFFPANKADRITGWQMMRRLLQDAGKLDVPGLYIARSCEYFWSTVPYLARDPRRVEDVRSDGPDHSADAARYGLLRDRRVVTQCDMWDQADAARRFRANGWK